MSAFVPMFKIVAIEMRGEVATTVVAVVHAASALNARKAMEREYPGIVVGNVERMPEVTRRPVVVFTSYEA